MAPADTQPAVVVEGVKQRYGSFHALDAVSFEVPTGTASLCKQALDDVFVSRTGRPAEAQAQPSGRALV